MNAIIRSTSFFRFVSGSYVVKSVDFLSSSLISVMCCTTAAVLSTRVSNVTVSSAVSRSDSPLIASAVVTAAVTVSEEVALSHISAASADVVSGFAKFIYSTEPFFCLWIMIFP